MDYCVLDGLSTTKGQQHGGIKTAAGACQFLLLFPSEIRVCLMKTTRRGSSRAKNVLTRAKKERFGFLKRERRDKKDVIERNILAKFVHAKRVKVMNVPGHSRRAERVPPSLKRCVAHKPTPSQRVTYIHMRCYSPGREKTNKRDRHGRETCLVKTCRAGRTCSRKQSVLYLSLSLRPNKARNSRKEATIPPRQRTFSFHATALPLPQSVFPALRKVFFCCTAATVACHAAPFGPRPPPAHQGTRGGGWRRRSGFVSVSRSAWGGVASSVYLWMDGVAVAASRGFLGKCRMLGSVASSSYLWLLCYQDWSRRCRTCQRSPCVCMCVCVRICACCCLSIMGQGVDGGAVYVGELTCWTFLHLLPRILGTMCDTHLEQRLFETTKKKRPHSFTTAQQRRHQPPHPYT